MKLPDLFKLDNLGSTRIWKVRTEDNKIIKTFGTLDGKLRDSVVIAHPKNIGRSNETTAEEQAIKEAQALWIKKKDREGYVENLEDLSTTNRFNVTLAYDYFNEAGVKKFNKYKTDLLFYSMKLNGVRMFVDHQNNMRSRKNMIFPITNRELYEDICSFKGWFMEITGFDDVILDGEIYKDGLTLGNIQSGIKKKTSVYSKQLEYHIFDFYSEKNKHLSFLDRYEILLQVFSEITRGAYEGKLHDSTKKIKLVECSLIPEGFDVVSAIMRAEDEGYEGLIIRLDLPYSQKRSPALFKAKKFKDKEFMIADVVPTKAYYDSDTGKLIPQGKFVVILDARTRLCQEIATEGSVEYKNKILLDKDKYIGKMATVKYKDYLDSGLLDLPVVMNIRMEGT